MMKHNGFTLIEVLIALAILGIALTAIIRTTSQNIQDNMYLDNKIIASWIATNTINEARAGLIQPPITPAHLEKETIMLKRRWTWQAYTENTANPHIKKIVVDVYLPSQDAPLIELESFLYAKE